MITGTAYGCKPLFVSSIEATGVRFIVKLKPTTKVEIGGEKRALQQLMDGIEWRTITLIHGRFGTELPCVMAAFEAVRYAGIAGRLLVAQIGGVSDDFYRSTFFGVSNARDIGDDELLHALAWTTWAGEALRQRRRQERASASLGQRAADGSKRDLPLPLDWEGDFARRCRGG